MPAMPVMPQERIHEFNRFGFIEFNVPIPVKPDHIRGRGGSGDGWRCGWKLP